MDDHGCGKLTVQTFTDEWLIFVLTMKEDIQFAAGYGFLKWSCQLLLMSVVLCKAFQHWFISHCAWFVNHCSLSYEKCKNGFSRKKIPLAST